MITINIFDITWTCLGSIKKTHLGSIFIHIWIIDNMYNMRNTTFNVSCENYTVTINDTKNTHLADETPNYDQEVANQCPLEKVAKTQGLHMSH